MAVLWGVVSSPLCVRECCCCCRRFWSARSDYRRGKFISSARRASDWRSIDMPAAQIRLFLAGRVWKLVRISAVRKKTQRLTNPLLLIFLFFFSAGTLCSKLWAKLISAIHPVFWGFVPLRPPPSFTLNLKRFEGRYNANDPQRSCALKEMSHKYWFTHLTNPSVVTFYLFSPPQSWWMQILVHPEVAELLKLVWWGNNCEAADVDLCFHLFTPKCVTELNIFGIC